MRRSMSFSQGEVIVPDAVGIRMRSSDDHGDDDTLILVMTKYSN